MQHDDHPARFRAALSQCPLVAILRGIRPDEVDAVGEVLVAAGFRIIEVPLNSPEALRSIARLSQRLGDAAIVGAGTVLTTDEVAQVRDAGGTLIVSPNTDPAVIEASVEKGLTCLPGFFTPSEAFTAIAAGAHGLKLFPADAASPAFLKALQAVLPSVVPVLSVGGIRPQDIQAWQRAGAGGFGLGSALYAPGSKTEEIATKAKEFVFAIDQNSS